MDYREDSFRHKFTDAARELGVQPAEIVSLKLRETVGSYTEYHDLLHTLEHGLALRCSTVQGNFQGQAHLLCDRQARVIVVEHETGLEILYVAGSIASLLGLIPTILRAWRAIQGGLSRRRHPGVERIEVRRFDDQGHLTEEPLHQLLAAPGLGLDGVDPALTSIGHLIEAQVAELASKLRSLADRVDALEKRSATRTKRRTPRPANKPASLS